MACSSSARSGSVRGSAERHLATENSAPRSGAVQPTTERDCHEPTPARRGSFVWTRRCITPPIMCHAAASSACAEAVRVGVADHWPYIAAAMRIATAGVSQALMRTGSGAIIGRTLSLRLPVSALGNSAQQSPRITDARLVDLLSSRARDVRKGQLQLPGLDAIHATEPHLHHKRQFVVVRLDRPPGKRCSTDILGACGPFLVVGHTLPGGDMYRQPS